MHVHLDIHFRAIRSRPGYTYAPRSTKDSHLLRFVTCVFTRLSWERLSAHNTADGVERQRQRRADAFGVGEETFFALITCFL